MVSASSDVLLVKLPDDRESSPPALIPSPALLSSLFSLWINIENILSPDMSLPAELQRSDIKVYSKPTEVPFVEPRDRQWVEREAYFIGGEDKIFLVTTPFAEVSLEMFFDRFAWSKINYWPKCPWYKFGQVDPWPSIIRQCLEGLEYLHTREPPIRHKDIKPANILLCEETVDPSNPIVRPIIIDFGISKGYEPGGWTNNTKSTYTHEAPEQSTEGGYEPTLASDIFSLGCCFAEMESIIYGGARSIEDFKKIVFEQSCQFARHLKEINEFLRKYEGPVFDYFEVSLYHVLRPLVEDMLAHDGRDRPSVSELLQKFQDWENMCASTLDAANRSLSVRWVHDLFATQVVGLISTRVHAIQEAWVNPDDGIDGALRKALNNVQVGMNDAIIKILGGRDNFTMDGSFYDRGCQCHLHSHYPTLAIGVGLSRSLGRLEERTRTLIKSSHGSIQTVILLDLSRIYRGRRNLAKGRRVHTGDTALATLSAFMDGCGNHNESVSLQLFFKDIICKDVAASLQGSDQIMIEISSQDLCEILEWSLKEWK
ncbi:hypothetical protein J7T55_006941 [Diaporthe amygdali]|uniref:uncharacterized protein n=1 Tax=Phomopsis amygdali TaxID=1214568 RepID=UPI0022FF12CB|nr:uncharacterized protein J7T55_006941 [Diaporthe amygdali]KAJ0107063.1 hypothetical protein J7T55_006941 [Diaporthe amygdali]